MLEEAGKGRAGVGGEQQVYLGCSLGSASALPALMQSLLGSRGAWCMLLGASTSFISQIYLLVVTCTSATSVSNFFFFFFHPNNSGCLRSVGSMQKCQVLLSPGDGGDRWQHSHVWCQEMWGVGEAPPARGVLSTFWLDVMGKRRGRCHLAL